jgi:hypothetical protein
MSDESTPENPRCLVCEEAITFLDDNPERPDKAVVVILPGGFGSALADGELLRGYLCDECLYVKGRNKLIQVVQSQPRVHRVSIRTWLPKPG